MVFPCPGCGERYVDAIGRDFGPVDQIVKALGQASEGTVDPQRAETIAKRAVEEACDNREGK